ncbi:class I SAM-dependent methyltransferase [Haloarcula marina]|uniref:class I SAM-dependent methyltransferase n=1 Tax=Haloarcula marina TaxID=2961574 RepID=UPI0020B8A271|nr:methyltransferase domain-containing protein [Halomicroarcula marina]
MSDDSLTAEQRIQESQYEFPYHYVPEFGSESFSQTRHWWWGFRYCAGLEVVFDALSDLDFESLLDVGCGDGRFLREVNRQYPAAGLLGIDYSERAVDVASALNPDIEYRCLDITDDERLASESYDVATLIEVLEHIPPDDLPSFLDGVVDALGAHGSLVVTVPHENKPTQEKHFQHFSGRELERLLEPHFDRVEMIPFDQIGSLGLRVARKLLGGRGNHVVVTNDTLNQMFYSYYLDNYLYTTEEHCGRIAAVCRR